MSKRLVTRNNITGFLTGDTLLLERDMLMTPGAVDYARIHGIHVVHGAQAETQAPTPVETPDTLRQRIADMLEKEFAITDSRTIQIVQATVVNLLATS
ncbi:MAG: hypothetical protein B0D91_15020 [Oceanospirillales bacterium LUC14_002_19_P2]|nr:MAG: hypothetical protein B0D91_15020 [Oceanospirillales bacterium LUC14_002_19_P2]